VTSTKFPPIVEQLSYLIKGAAEVIRDEELKSKLENAQRTGKPLRVYLGVDPTAPDIHLGHTVVLRKLKHFQDMGHTAIFLIGDFSAMIGDPTGQSETRPPLTREQVDANAKTYLDQVYKILDPKKTEVRYNSEWLGKMSSFDVVRLCGHYRLARMLEREDFRSRLEKNLPISVHELLYPLLTAYDAVALESDVEIGATEQKFNLLVHRDIQREFGQASEVALTMPILVGLDGGRKMSKSLANYVGITEAPGEMFGKLMSISDDLMWSYYELLTDFPSPVIVRLKEEVRGGTLHPMDAKMQLAHAIIAGFQGDAAAKKASEEFQRVFRDRQAPEAVPEYRLRLLGSSQMMLSKKWGDSESALTVPWKLGSRPRWSKLLMELGIVDSTSEADRLVKQGGLEVNGIRLSDVKSDVDLSNAGQFLIKAGKKKFLKIIVE
jgi:tyrosyl-tRNA synthetase